jgi:hypothetical protein
LNPDWIPDLRDPQSHWPQFHIPAAPWWPRLREELLALDYHTVGLKTGLIHKKDLEARLGRSPDLADALIQIFAQ